MRRPRQPAILSLDLEDLSMEGRDVSGDFSMVLLRRDLTEAKVGLAYVELSRNPLLRCQRADAQLSLVQDLSEVDWDLLRETYA